MEIVVIENSDGAGGIIKINDTGKESISHCRAAKFDILFPVDADKTTSRFADEGNFHFIVSINYGFFLGRYQLSSRLGT